MTTFGRGNGWGWDGGNCGTTTTGRICFIKELISNERFQLGNGLTVIEYGQTWRGGILPDGTNTFTFITGYGNTTNSTTQASGCYFSLGWNGSAVQWSTVTSNASTATTTTSSASVPSATTDFFDFRIVIDASRANVYFYLRKNGGSWELANTHTSNIPANATTAQISPLYGIFKSAGTTAAHIYTDYYRSYTILTTPR